MLTRWTLAVAGGFLLIAGCASVDTRMTAEQMTNARVAVEAAEKDDAKVYAEDPLRRAQDALAIAKDAYTNQDFTRAFDFSKKATLYARIAKARTEQKKAEQRLAGLKEQLEKTRTQTDASMASVETAADVTPTAQPQAQTLPPAGSSFATAQAVSLSAQPASSEQLQSVTGTAGEGVKP